MKPDTNGFSIKPLLALTCFSVIAMLGSASLAHANSVCKDGVPQLQGSYDVVQAKGGLWGFLEQSSGLKDKSVLGLQTDGKIQRALVMLTTSCENGKAPSVDDFNAVQDVIGDARMVFNMKGRTPPKKILETIQAINAKADKVLASLPQ